MKLSPGCKAFQAFCSCPIVEGREIPNCLWFRVNPKTVTICSLDPVTGKEITKEYNIHTVALSGYLLE